MDAGSARWAATFRARLPSPTGSHGRPVENPAPGSPSQGIGVRSGSRPRPGTRRATGSRTWPGGIGTSSRPSSSTTLRIRAASSRVSGRLTFQTDSSRM